MATYSYQPPSSHLLTQVTNPFSQVVESMAYTNTLIMPQVISQTLQDKGQLQFAYLPNSTLLTTLGPDGRRTIQRFDYAADNTLTGITDMSNSDQPELLLEAVYF